MKIYQVNPPINFEVFLKLLARRSKEEWMSSPSKPS
jgi:hypothetical protein